MSEGKNDDSTVKTGAPKSASFVTKFLPYLEWLNQLKVLGSLRESVMWSIPVVLIGFAVVFFFLEPSGKLAARGMRSFSAALGLMGPWIALFLPFTHSRRQNLTRGIISGLLSLTVFVFLLPAFSWNSRALVDLLSLLSRGGILVGMACGLISVAVDDLVSPRVDYVIFYPVKVLLGAGLAGGAYLLSYRGVNFFILVERAIAPLLSGADTLPAAMLVVGLMSLLWLGGIHGSGVVGGAVLPFYMVAFNANIAAHAAGAPLPYVITPPFFILCMIGGTGATLPLCVYMLFSRSTRFRKVAAVSILPAMINVNEPLIFGVPLVMNPTVAIPFVLTPVVIAVVNYAAFYFRWLERIYLFPPFTLPTPVYGYLTNLDWRSVVLVLVDVAIAFALYRPFFLTLEKIELNRERKQAEGFKKEEPAAVDISPELPAAADVKTAL